MELKAERTSHGTAHPNKMAAVSPSAQLLAVPPNIALCNIAAKQRLGSEKHGLQRGKARYSHAPQPPEMLGRWGVFLSQLLTTSSTEHPTIVAVLPCFPAVCWIYAAASHRVGAL